LSKINYPLTLTLSLQGRGRRGIRHHLDPPPSRGRKVGKDDLNRDCFVTSFLAMTERMGSQ